MIDWTSLSTDEQRIIRTEAEVRGLAPREFFNLLRAAQATRVVDFIEHRYSQGEEPDESTARAYCLPSCLLNAEEKRTRKR